MEDDTIAYAEVYEILSHMDKLTVMKIPIDIINVFKNNRNKDFKSNIDRNDLFNKNNISEMALNILLWLDLEFWADENEKKKLFLKYTENDKKIDEQRKNNYLEGMFKTPEKNTKNSLHELMITTANENCFIRLINKIKNKFFSNI